MTEVGAGDCFNLFSVFKDARGGGLPCRLCRALRGVVLHIGKAQRPSAAGR